MIYFLIYDIILIMDKTITVIHKSDKKISGYVPGTMDERISMVWPLTCEVVSLSNKYDVEQPLQRHIINIVRNKDLADIEMLEDS